jgi:hypothetical protein
MVLFRDGDGETVVAGRRRKLTVARQTASGEQATANVLVPLKVLPYVQLPGTVWSFWLSESGHARRKKVGGVRSDTEIHCIDDFKRMHFSGKPNPACIVEDNARQLKLGIGASTDVFVLYHNIIMISSIIRTRSVH